MAEHETLLVRKDDGVAWVSLNRPDVRNAINKQMQDELAALWHDFRYDDESDSPVWLEKGLYSLHEFDFT